MDNSNKKQFEPLLITILLGVVIVVAIIIMTTQLTGNLISNTPTTISKGSATAEVGLTSGTVYIGQENVSANGLEYLDDDVANVVENVVEISSISGEATIYNISMLENTQRDIWTLCQQNNLAYELVLAIYQIEGDNSIHIDSIKAEIEKLVYLREYWAQQNFSDEIVFDLMLLARNEGIEESIISMKDNDSYGSDNDYVQKVTEYKNYLDQM